MLIVLLIFLLVSNALSLKRDHSILFSRTVMKYLILISFIAYLSINLNSLEKGIGLYGGLFSVTTFTQTFSILILLISAIILVLTSFYPRKLDIGNYLPIYNIFIKKLYYNKNSIFNKKAKQFSIIEYPLIIVFIISGAVFLIVASDLISIFLSIELQSYGLYLLCTLYRDSESSTASGLTYFLLGGLSSCFILLGSALLYINSGTTSLDNLYVMTSISQVEHLYSIAYIYQPYYYHLSLIIMSVGFLFKISAAPFHFWSPDVYDGIPTIVTTYVAIVAKLSILAILLEIVYYTEYYYIDFSWKSIFILSSLFSLIIGSVLGLVQFRIKRLLAYSTISHVGFILLALSINNTESIQSYVFYIIQYTISNLNIFILLISIGISLYIYIYNNINDKETMIDENNSPVQLISQIKGYFYVNPFIAISLSITLFSFIGIPPIMGFFAKQMILSSALDSGYVFMSFIAIITSVIGAAYYLNLIKQITFNKNDFLVNPDIINKNIFSVSQNNTHRTIKFRSEDIVITSSLSITISVITLTLLLFIYMPGEWFNIASIISLTIFKA